MAKYHHISTLHKRTSSGNAIPKAASQASHLARLRHPARAEEAAHQIRAAIDFDNPDYQRLNDAIYVPDFNDQSTIEELSIHLALNLLLRQARMEILAQPMRSPQDYSTFDELLYSPELKPDGQVTPDQRKAERLKEEFQEIINEEVPSLGDDSGKDLHTLLSQELLEEKFATRRAELLVAVERALERSQAAIEALLELHSQFAAEWMRLTPAEQNIVSYFIRTSGSFCSRYPSKTEHEHDSEQSIKEVAKELERLQPISETLRCLTPRSQLFHLDWLDVDYRDLEHRSSWEEIDIRIPPRRERWLLGNAREAVLPMLRVWEELEPAMTFDQLLLPQDQLRNLRALCRQFKADREAGLAPRLTLFFRGPPGTGKTMTAHAVAHALGIRILRVNFPENQRMNFIPLVTYFTERARAGNQLLLFDECEDLLAKNAFVGRSDSWAKLLFEQFEGACAFTTNYDISEALKRRMTLVLEFETPTAGAREQLFSRKIEKSLESGGIPSLSSPERISEIMREYPISAGYYDQAIQLARALATGDEALPIEQALETAVKTTFRGAEGMHSPGVLEPRIQLSKVQLNASEHEEVRRLLEFAKGRVRELRRNPLAPQGVTALFSGPPGTGKTLTAEAIAGELSMPLRRVSPSDFLNMFVGGTEARIRATFAQAEDRGELLFIDEAEGLFLDRQGARNSWERTQVDELLQRVEAFRGVLILASNHAELMDSAFARRLLFHVQFRLPTASVREQLWSMWSESLPVSSEDLRFLAQRFELSGGEIRNIVARALARGLKSLPELESECESALSHRTGRTHRKMGF